MCKIIEPPWPYHFPNIVFCCSVFKWGRTIQLAHTVSTLESNRSHFILFNFFFFSFHSQFNVMSRLLHEKLKIGTFFRVQARNYSVADKIPKKVVQLPEQVDVAIIGKMRFERFCGFLCALRQMTAIIVNCLC